MAFGFRDNNVFLDLDSEPKAGGSKYRILKILKGATTRPVHPRPGDGPLLVGACMDDHAQNHETSLDPAVLCCSLGCQGRGLNFGKRGRLCDLTRRLPKAGGAPHSPSDQHVWMAHRSRNGAGRESCAIFRVPKFWDTENCTRSPAGPKCAVSQNVGTRDIAQYSPLGYP